MFCQNRIIYLGSIYDFSINKNNILKNDNTLFIKLIETKSYNIEIKNAEIISRFIFCKQIIKLNNNKNYIRYACKNHFQRN